MHFRLLFLSLIIRCSGASSDINFQDGEFMSYTFGTEPKSAFLTSEPQNGGADHQFGLVTAETPFAALGSSEANIIQSNNDECGPYDPAPSSRKMRSKRESPRICYPPSARRNSPPSVQGTGSHNPSEKDPKDSTEKDSQGNAQQQPSRNFAPAEGSDCATIPSAPLSVCAVVNADHIRHDLVVPMSGISSGWWQLEYSRGAPPACYREVGEIFFCCAFVFSNAKNLRFPILRAQYPLTAVSCLPMEDMNLPSEAPQP